MTATTTMTHRRRWLVGLAALTLVAALAACTSAEAGGPGTSPTGAPAPSPSSTPAPASPDPSDGGSDAMPIVVDLETSNDAEVVIDIVDRTGFLADARSGAPGDGASVAPYEVRVERVDERSLRLTWVDFPHDNRLGMWIDEVDGGLRIVIVQPAPTGPTDAIALDRSLELTFDRAIHGLDIETILQDGVDTPA